MVKISTHYGIVIRKKALNEKGVELNKVIEAFEGDAPLDQNDTIISFGPHFGLDNVEVLDKRLNKIGLEYIDDYFYFFGDFPELAEFSVSLK